MTIRQVLLAMSSAAAGASAIAFKGYRGVSSTTMTLPTHATDDTIFMFARSSYFGSTPTVPAGWTTIDDSRSFSGYKVVIAKKVAASSGETCGTWTNASNLLSAVYDGVASSGTPAWWKGGSTTTWSGITASGWVMGVGFFSGGAGYDTPPSGMTHRGASSDAIALHDTAAPSSWSSKTTFGSYSASATFVLELVSE